MGFYAVQFCILTVFSPHTCEAACDLLLDVIRDWNLTEHISCIATDNAFDMVKGVELLRRQLAVDVPDMYCTAKFQVRYIAHTFDIAVKECMALIHAHISTTRSLINSIRSSVKRRDVFDTVRAELNCTTEVPRLDT